jgi:two-component system, NarL family, sensor kinase
MKHFYSIFFLLIVNISLGQNAELDSLLKLLPKAKPDTNLVLTYLKIGSQLAENKPAEAKAFYRKAEKLSESINYKKGIFKFIASYVNVLNHEGHFDSSIVLNLKSIKIAKELNNQRYIATGYVNAGVAYSANTQYEIAMKYYLAGQKIFYEMKDLRSEAAMDDMLQLHFFNLNQYKKAIEYGEKAILKSRKIKDSNILGRSLNNAGLSYLAVDNQSKAKMLFSEALEIGLKIDNQNLVLNEYINLADIFSKNREYEKMKINLDKGLKLSQEMEYFEKEAVSKNMLSIYYSAKKKYTKAEELANEALFLSKKYDFKTLKTQAYRSLSSIAFAKHNFELGQQFNNEAEAIGDSLLNESIEKNTIELETKYQTQQKEAQIKIQTSQLKQKTTNNILLIGGIAAIGLLSLLGFFNYQNRQRIDAQKIKELEQEKQLTAVSSIMQGQEKERSRMAKDLHDGLGGILSGIKLNLSAMRGNQIIQEADANIFSRSISQLDTAIQEMRRVAHNLMPEALLKFGLNEAVQDFCDGINQANTVKMKYNQYGPSIPNDQSLQVILYRIIQELSNNAIKYAEAKTILIQLTKNEADISLTVEDDGKGFNVAELEKNKGVGIENVISRVNYLKGTFTIDAEIGKGTSCFVVIPNQYIV